MEGRSVQGLVFLLLLAGCATDISDNGLKSSASGSNQLTKSVLQKVESWHYSLLCSVWGVFPIWIGRLLLKVPLLEGRMVEVGPPPSCANLILTVQYHFPSSSDLNKLKESKLPVVWVVGGPAAGKGMFCKRMASSEGYTHISVGNLIRVEANKDSDSHKGRVLNSIMKQGELLPDSVALTFLAQEMLSRLGGSHGFLIDGFPRSLKQAKMFQNKIKPPDVIVSLEVSPETMKQRVLNRKDGRADDNEETIAKRLAVFFKHQNLITSNKMFADKVKTVNTEGDVDTNYLKFTKAIQETIKRTN